MDIFLPPPIGIHPYFGYRSRTRLVIGARALRARQVGFEKAGRLAAIRTMLAQFASREEAGVPVTLEVRPPGRSTLRHHARTDAEGFVQFDIALDPPVELPTHTSWEVVSLHWPNRDASERVEGHVLAPGTGSGVAVISDIDDTIIETGITGGLRALVRNWRRLLAELPEDRIAVPGADLFYNALGGSVTAGATADSTGDRIAATHRPFFYVSSSPWNLFAYLVAFKRAKGLPLGPLLLRDWAPNAATFGAGSHGDHKAAAIDELLETFRDWRFALIGDDTQGDLPAYAHAASRHSGRISAIFIRTLAGDHMTADELAAIEAIRAAGVPLWMGASFATGQEFLATMGFTPGGETEQIVRAVDKVPTKAEIASPAAAG